MALRISVITGSLGAAGAGVAAAVNSLYREMNRATDMSVTIHCAEMPEATAPMVKRYATIGPARFGFSPQLPRDLAEANPDLVHVHGLWSYGSIAAAAWHRRSGRPVVVSPHGMLDAWALSASAVRKKLALLLFERRNLSAADCLHALNRAEAASMRALGLGNPIAVIPNGVDLPPAMSRAQNPHGPKHLLFLGRIHPKKGLEQLLRAWALLSRATPDIAQQWVVDIVGWDEGGHLKQLQALVRDLSLQDRVNFHGPAFGAEKTRVLTEADAFVLPSVSEGLPMTVLEAWAYGLPVFMTRACNLPIGFEARAAVEISNEPEQMAAQFAATFADDRALADVGRAGRKLAEDKFTWSEAASHMIGVYQWLATGRARPGFVENA